MRRMTILTLILVFLLLISFLSCSKVNKENYDVLKIGMEYAEVEEILGNPDDCNSALKSKRCTWGNNNKYIKVTFVANRVLFFEGKGL